MVLLLIPYTKVLSNNVLLILANEAYIRFLKGTYKSILIP